MLPKEKFSMGCLPQSRSVPLFERLNVPYDMARLNPISNSDLYLSSSKASINLGIYGVDLGYLKMFDQNQEMFNYMLSIRSFCNKLNIPENYITDPIKRIEKDLGDSDSLLAIMNQSYNQIEDHLRHEWAGEYGRSYDDGWLG